MAVFWYALAMIIKNATQVGNPVIRAVSKPVKNTKSKVIKDLVKNLTDSMRHHGLVGMAAPQVGISLRVFVTEIRRTKLRKDQSKKEADGLRTFINPRITSYSKKQVYGWEGCGSVASSNLFGYVKRSESVNVTALNGNGEKFTLEAKGLLARVIQHEYDHINGKVFVDRLENMKSLMSRDEYLKMRNK